MENKTWTYADRYRHIKEVKIRHTEEKRIQQGGFMTRMTTATCRCRRTTTSPPSRRMETLSVIQAGRRILPLCWRFIPFMWTQLKFLCGRWGDQLTNTVRLREIIWITAISQRIGSPMTT